MIEAIVAVNRDWGIGAHGTQSVVLHADRKHFRAVTDGAAVIVGRKTLADFPGGKPLPNRRNIVLTRQKDYNAPGIEVFASLQEALAVLPADAHIYIIGGASVYAEALPLADRLCLTHLHASPDDADVFFPEIDKGEWRLLSEEHHEADEQNEVPYTFADYERVKA